MRVHRRAPITFALAALLLTGACGGGDDDSSDSATDDALSGQTGVEAGDDGDDLVAVGDVVVGEPTLTAEPATAWAEVDGERLEYAAAGSIHFNCAISDQQVTVNFQTAEGHDFLLQGAPQDDTWFLNTTFAPGGTNDRFTVDSLSGLGRFVIGDGTLSYEGTVNRIVDFDVANAEEADARIAVNCESAGGDPTATVGGETFVFPLSGAQSVTCDVSATAIDVSVNRLALEGLQLTLSATDQDGQWVGAAVVYTADGNFTSTLPPDGSGLTLDGTSVTYAGSFETPDGGEVDGTVDITC